MFLKIILPINRMIKKAFQLEGLFPYIQLILNYMCFRLFHEIWEKRSKGRLT